ncbi:hypothetical protein KR222_003139, partial [Zaprionus bogoriensis]
ALLEFAQLTQNASLYTQFWRLNELENLQYQLVDHKLTKLAVYMDISCNGSAGVLDMANVKRLYSDQYHWLIIDGSFNFAVVNARFANAELNINTELTYVEHSPRHTNFILYDLYNKAKHLGAMLNITQDQEIICSEQHCHVGRYLSDLYKRPRLQHRRLLTGLTVRINSALTSLPLSTPETLIKHFLSSQGDTYKDPFARLGYQTYQVLKDMLDCNYSFIFRDRWTDSDATGGLIGDLRNDSVDLTATAFLYTSERAKHMKILSWHCSFRSVCMFRNPRSALAELRIAEFLQPFSWSVWLMFSALLVFAGALLWLTFQVERRLNRKSSSTLRSPSLLTSCLLSFGAACIQGAWILPRSTGGRMIFYATILTCFLMYNYYTSVVVSTLLGDPPKSKIRTVQQLADSNLEVSVEPTAYTKVYVEVSYLVNFPNSLCIPRSPQTANYSDVLSLYRKKVLNSRRDPQRIWLPSEQGVLMVRNQPGFVYIAEAASAYVFVRKHFLPHEICELNEILLRDETSAYTMVAKISSFGELIKLNQLRLLETGIHFKHFNYWIRSKLHCYKGNITVVVGLETAGPLFLLLLGAYIVCLFVLGLEVLWHRRQLR